jgi:hypothetical protein
MPQIRFGNRKDQSHRLSLQDCVQYDLFSRIQSVSMSIFSLDTSYLSFTDALITGSWDQTLRFWDPRSPSPQQSSHETPERVYQIDLVNNTLVVAMASRLFNIYDIRKMDSPAQQRESSLKFMTRSLACMVDGQGAFFLPENVKYP